MTRARFEWDDEKDKENQLKHNVSFALAQHAFLDPYRVIAEDVTIAAMKIDSTVLALSVTAY
jgi:uncharacterized DUF497 family protein